MRKFGLRKETAVLLCPQGFLHRPGHDHEDEDHDDDHDENDHDDDHQDDHRGFQGYTALVMTTMMMTVMIIAL